MDGVGGKIKKEGEFVLSEVGAGQRKGRLHTKMIDNKDSKAHSILGQ